MHTGNGVVGSVGKARLPAQGVWSHIGPHGACKLDAMECFDRVVRTTFQRLSDWRLESLEVRTTWWMLQAAQARPRSVGGGGIRLPSRQRVTPDVRSTRTFVP